MTYAPQFDLESILGQRCPEKESAAASGKANGTNNSKPTKAYEKEDSTLSTSILDLPLPVSLFPSKNDVMPRHETISLRQLVERMRRVKASDKRVLPLLKLGTFEGGRKAEHLVARHGIEIDYDAGEVSADEAAARLRAANLAAVVVTSSSHTPEAPRWRVLAPTASPVSPAEATALVERINGALGGIAGKESFDPARCYFYGGIRDKAAPEVHLIEGRPVDLAPDLPRIGKAAALPDLFTAPDDADDLLQDRPVDWQRIRSALRTIKDASDRETWLQIGMALHHESRGSLEGFDLWCKWSNRCPDKYDLKAQRIAWGSFGKRTGAGIGIGTLYDHAKRCGWNPSPGAQLADPELESILGPRIAPAAKSRLSFLSPSDCEAAPSRGYVLKGFLAPGDVGCIVGAPGAGKSLLAPFLGYAVAQGREVFGMRAKGGGVFYVAAEDPHGMRGRIKALKATHGDAQGFQLVAGVSDLLAPESPDLAALLEAVKARRPALIFLDTLAMAFPGLEENSAEGMGRVVAAARALTAWGAAVVLIHHDTKDQMQGLPRGHSLLNGALDVALHIKRDESSGVIRGRLTKNRNGPCDKDLAFTIATVDGGQDEDGDEIRLPFAMPCSAAAAATFKADKLPRSERAALDVLERAGGRLAEATYKDTMADGRDVSASDNAKSRRDVATRAIRGLLDRALIKFEDGFYSIHDEFDDAEPAFDDAATTRHDATDGDNVAIVVPRQTDAATRPTRQGDLVPVALSRRFDAPTLKDQEGGHP